MTLRESWPVLVFVGIVLALTVVEAVVNEWQIHRRRRGR